MKGIVRRKAIDTQNDPYLLKVGPKGVNVCKKCGSVHRDKRWVKKGEAPEALYDAHDRGALPCLQEGTRQVRAGSSPSKGAFVDNHRDEIIHLIRNKEKRGNS